MNKLILLIIGGVIVVGGGVAFLVTRDDGNNATVTNTTTGQSQSVKTGNDAIIAVDACDVLTEAAAKKVIGEGATKSDISAGNASSNDISVSNCIYTVKIDPSAIKANNTKGVSVLARSAKTSTGAESNKLVFGSGKPAGVQDVSGVGDKAFFNPKFGQLNVLKGSNYYIVTSYSGSATSGTLESDKQLAQELNFK